ncbi:hypothetical protein EUGRSUZ_C03674 [Eucalyptus grandis]|uniref:Uncharacterized protein n=2 Tax=Eucalyptus grandis TaxID=71139 RepID=A0ACC3LIY0_EUCGR|nr:hypothetical protein EUGRSUZ_C03674 [Eucalyptus grandis]
MTQDKPALAISWKRIVFLRCPCFPWNCRSFPKLDCDLGNSFSRVQEMEPTAKLVSEGSSGLLQSDELYNYVLMASVYPRESEILKELRDAIANHPQSYFATAPDGGQFIALLLKLLNAKKTIEVGVFTGYSLLLTALTILQDGKIIAIDVDREAYEIGLPFIKKANVEHKIDFVESQALPVLTKLLENQENESSFDIAFLDADWANQKNYHKRLPRLVRLVRAGGVIIYDNTLWGGTVTLSGRPLST